MLRRLGVSTIVLWLVACAPSVPRPAEKPRVVATDGAADQAAASTRVPDDRSDARTDSRAAASTLADARFDGTGDARLDTRDVPETSLQDPPDRSPEVPVVIPVDLRVDLLVDLGVGLHVDVPPEIRPESRADVGTETAAETGREPGDAAARDALVDGGPFATLPHAGDVVIDELLVNPAGTDTNREWIEITNTTALALDLRLLHVADAANEVAVDAGVLAPGGILVLGQSFDATRNGGGPVDLSFGNSISLNNPGDSIMLCLGPCADALILSQVSWTSDLGAAYDGHAAIVDPASGAFCPADQPFGTAGSFGSPGAINSRCVF